MGVKLCERERWRKKKREKGRGREECGYSQGIYMQRLQTLLIAT